MSNLIQQQSLCTYTAVYLQSGMSVELIEEVHEEVDLERADTQHHVFLSLGSVPAVVSPRLLTLHPQVRKFLKLIQTQNL